MWAWKTLIYRKGREEEEEWEEKGLVGFPLKMGKGGVSSKRFFCFLLRGRYRRGSGRALKPKMFFLLRSEDHNPSFPFFPVRLKGWQTLRFPSSSNTCFEFGSDLRHFFTVFPLGNQSMSFSTISVYVLSVCNLRSSSETNASRSKVQDSPRSSEKSNRGTHIFPKTRWFLSWLLLQQWSSNVNRQGSRIEGGNGFSPLSLLRYSPFTKKQEDLLLLSLSPLFIDARHDILFWPSASVNHFPHIKRKE